MELHLPPECLPEVSTPNSLTWSITDINFSLNANFVPVFPSMCAANASPTSMSMSMTRKYAEIKGPSGTLAPRFCHSSCRCINGKSKCGAALLRLDSASRIPTCPSWLRTTSVPGNLSDPVPDQIPSSRSAQNRSTVAPVCSRTRVVPLFTLLAVSVQAGRQ
jgi:hypothetical protein